MTWTKKKCFTADFETCTWLENETYVWAWAVCEIGKEQNFYYGNNIESFIEFVKNQQNAKFYFHNLKFDSEFALYYLLENNFKVVESKEDLKENSIYSIISDMGQFYKIRINFEYKNNKLIYAEFIDSLKMIPFSVSETAKVFNIEEQKLELDYNKWRSRNHVLTSEEIAYIKNDVVIMAKALNQMFKKGLTKMTRASNSLEDFRKIFGKDRFNLFFPKLDFETDSDIRQSYKGGFTYLNPTYKEKEVGSGNVIDVNSLYPYCMYEKLLPYGDPVFFEGKYKQDKDFPLFIQMLTCRFKLKKDMIPTIQIKNSFSFIPNEYLESSDGEIVGLCLTSIDLEMFFRHYEVTDLKFISGYKFKGIHGIFTQYIDKWIKEKIEATIEKNKGKRTIAKLMLNSLYGKFAKVMKMRSKIPFIGEDDIVHYAFTDYEITDGIYIPIGSFITAYAREKTIETSQKIHEYSLKKYGKSLYYYSDTDSIHTGLSEEELKQFVEIDPVKLGAWALESSFSKAKFLRQKCYVEVVNDQLEITCAGLPKNCYNQVTWENFKMGFTCSGKLTFKHVKGGVKLVETDFTIKEEKLKNTIKNLQSII